MQAHAHPNKEDLNDNCKPWLEKHVPGKSISGRCLHQSILMFAG